MNEEGRAGGREETLARKSRDSGKTPLDISRFGSFVN